MKKSLKQLLIVLGIFFVTALIILTTQIYFNANSVRSTFDNYQITDTGDYLIPGPGWSGPTAQPATIGNPSDFGYDARAIAHWDVVPFQTFNETINVAVVAFHANDIDNVSFSVNNGSWVAVKNMSLNPETGVVEYWATLNSSDFEDGPLEIRAIAYPRVGIPRVLQGTSIMNENSSLILNANLQGILSHKIRYVSLTGDDDNNCLTELTACRTIASAINKSSSSGLGSSVDGSEIKLGEGNWQLPVIVGDPWWTQAYTDSTQWVTITSSQSANPNNVQITGMDTVSCPNGNTCGGMGFAHLHLYNLSVVGHIGSSPGAGAGSYLWFDHVFIHHIDPSILCIDMVPIPGWGSAGIWQGVYYTDVHMNNTDNGPGGIISRNVYAEITGGGHSSGSATVINYSLKSTYGGYYTMPNGCQTGDIHGDIYQMYARTQDVIMYGINIIPGGALRSTRGLAVGGDDTAIINVNLGNYNEGMWVFSSCGGYDSFGSPYRLNHFVIKNSIFPGAGNWCGESPGAVADTSMFFNILIENSVFDNGNPLQVPYPWNSSGIKYRNMQAMFNAGIIDNGSCPLDYVSNITQYNITWFFDKCYRAGQFVNGDYWVKTDYATGIVNITNITPMAENGRNGWEINPIPGNYQPYDNRAGSYLSSLQPNLPLVVHANSSIVKTVSGTYSEALPTYLKTAAVLTVLGFVPSDEGRTTFRPPYVGTNKSLFSSQNLRTYLLLNLSPVANTPTLNSALEGIQKVQLDHKTGEPGRATHPLDNMPNYGAGITGGNGANILRLSLDDSLNEKMPLLIASIQAGIDYMGIAKNGGEWPADGGHGSGRKIMILFAGLMLNDSEMLNISKEIQFSNIFSEDIQTFYTSENPPFVNASNAGCYLALPEKYRTIDGFARYAYHYPDNPGEDVQCSTPWNSYWTLNSPSWIGQTLVAHLYSLTDEWNHQAYFDHLDRYVEMNGIDGVWGNEFNNNMWDAYRNYSTCFDSILNGDETGIDCGGVCTACAVVEPPVEEQESNNGGGGGGSGGGGGGAIPVKNATNSTGNNFTGNIQNSNNTSLVNEENNPEVNFSTKEEEKVNVNVTFNQAIKLISIIAGLVVIMGAIWFGIYKIFLFKTK